MRRLATLLLLGSWLMAVLVSPGAPALASDGVVGSGAAGSCTEAAFDAVLNTVQATGGGIVTFNCGAAAHTIVFSAQKAISANVELRGGGLITLSGGNSTGLLQVLSGQTLTLRSITITRGSSATGAIETFGRLDIRDSQLTANTSAGSGGAITAHGDVSLTNVILSGNVAAGLGGGLYIDGGTTTIANSQLNDNQAANGGGIAVGAGSNLVVSNSRFQRNQGTAAFAEGGALRSAGQATVSDTVFVLNNAGRGGGAYIAGGSATFTRSTFDTNWGAYGGGIRQVGGTLTVTDSTFTHNGYNASGAQVSTGGGGLSWDGGAATLSGVLISGNWASYGGGFDLVNGAPTLTNVTLSGNTAVGGGAFDQGGGTLSLTNVTVAENRASFFAAGISSRTGTLTIKNVLLSANLHPQTLQGFNCNKALATGTFSLSSDVTCGLEAGRNSVALPLGPLALNGGHTATHLLPEGSPAIGAGTGIGCPATDQRGVARPVGAACDVGAVEATAADFIRRLYLPEVRR